MNKNYILITFISIISVNAFADLNAQAALKKTLANISQIDAKFDQSVLSDGVVVSEMHGSLKLSKPCKMRWEIQDPYNLLVIANCHELWMYDSGLKQATVMNLADAVNDSPFALMLNPNDEFWSKFDVSENQPNIFTIKKQDLLDSNNSYVLTFKNNTLSKFEIYQGNEKNNEFIFTPVKKTHKFDDSLFDLDLPDDVIVDDQRK